MLIRFKLATHFASHSCEKSGKNAAVFIVAIFPLSGVGRIQYHIKILL